MNSLELKQEAIVISEYCFAIQRILATVNELSLIKLYTFTYIYNKNSFNKWSIYSGLDTSDVVYKCLSCMSGLFDDYCKNLKYIIYALDLLIKSDFVVLKDGYISKTDNNVEKPTSVYYTNLIKAVSESVIFTDAQFLKEVIRNV